MTTKSQPPGTLGVSKDASAEDIKKAYKKLARENHPDLNPGDTEAEKKFKEISEASSVLGDERKRQEYDQVRAMGASGFGGFGGQGFNVDDFGDLFGNLGDIFGFGGSGGRRKGQTYQTNINISFDEAAKGVETVIPLRKEVSCQIGSRRCGRQCKPQPADLPTGQRIQHDVGGPSDTQLVSQRLRHSALALQRIKGTAQRTQRRPQRIGASRRIGAGLSHQLYGDGT